MPLTPKQLRKEAERMRAEAERLIADADEADAYANRMEARLREGNQTGSLDDMVAAERVRHSQGKSGKRSALVDAANDAHLTLRSLAEKVGKSHSYLSQAHAGDRTMRRELAEKIEKLTGFEASQKNWPKITG